MAYIQYYKHLIDLLETTADSKKTSRGIFKQMTWTAAFSCAGAFVAGPPGALLGGIAGAVSGYYMSDDYNSMVTVIKNLSDADKKQLVEKIQKLVGSITLDDLDAFINSPGKLKLLIDCIRPYNRLKSKACQYCH